MPFCHIALGGNLGEVSETFLRALDLLNDSGASVRVASSVYRTAPVGELAGNPFLNAAAGIETRLDPVDLLDRLQSIETRLGRTRDVRWGPRTLDLDLLFYDDLILESPRLTIPHPACWYRRFVLDPLGEIAPELIHPARRRSIRALRQRLMPRPLPVAVVGGKRHARRQLIGRMTKEFPQVRFSHWKLSIDDPEIPSCAELAMILCLDSSKPVSQLAECNPAWLSLVSSKPEGIQRDEAVRHILQSALDEPIAIGSL